MAEFDIRLARRADHDRLQDIFRRASLSNAEDRAVLLEHPGVLRLDPELIDGGRTWVATTADGDVVGFASSRVIGNGVLELDDLFVDPQWWRHGIATQLMRRLIEEAVAERVVRLDVTANHHALAFYRSAGFEGDATVATEFGVGIRMHLRLNAAPPVS